VETAGVGWGDSSDLLDAEHVRAWLEDEIDVVLKAVVLNFRDDAIGVEFRRRSC
jgi:hypothetical protein